MKKIFLIALLALSCGFISVPPASADLLISPLQVVMEGRDRSTQITLVNTGRNKNTYRLEWVQLEQATIAGGYQAAEKTLGQTHLKDFAVFTPRQITLLPQEKQTIRMAVRRPADLPDGEYKTHLKFGITTSEEVVSPLDSALGDNEFRVGAKVLASYTIPVVYRVGEYDCKITVGAPSFTANPVDGQLQAKFLVEREGIHGAIGLLEVYHKPDGGEEVFLGRKGNANLFPEIDRREVKVSLGVTGLAKGTLRAVFKKAEGQLADHVVLDEKTFPIRN